MKACIVAGSFDPIHNGHLDLIRHAQSVFEKVIVVVTNNSEKSNTFSLSNRIGMVNKALVSVELDKVEVVGLNNKFLANYARDRDVEYILRGVRNAKDYDYEVEVAKFNHGLNQGLYTLFLPSSEKNKSVSSSFVKGLVGIESWKEIVPSYVPDAVFQNLMIMEGRKHWNRLSEQFYNSFEVFYSTTFNRKYDVLAKRYTNQSLEESPLDSERHYHTIRHILDSIEILRKFTTKAPILEFALWTHDVVYNIGRMIKDVEESNEAASAKYARELLKDCLPKLTRNGKSETVIQAVESLILATKTHTPSKDNTINLFLDVDLAILGRPWLEYKEYAHKVRKEFDIVSSKDFAAGRTEFIKKMLGRERIFNSNEFKSDSYKWENVARANLESELTWYTNE